MNQILDARNGVTQNQPYVDEPIIRRPIKRMRNLDEYMAIIYGHIIRIPVTHRSGETRIQVLRTDLPATILLGYRRTWLNWVKPRGATNV